MDSKGEGYDKRRIPAAKWVTTSVELDVPEGRRHVEAFMRLFHYINGTNSKKEKIDMTIPVINKMALNESYEVAEQTMSFYLPSKYQGENGDEVPIPEDDKINVEDWVSVVTYSKAFGKDIPMHDHEEAKKIFQDEIYKLLYALAD